MRNESLRQMYSRAHAPEFFTQATLAFAFLLTAYGYHREAQQIEWPDDARETRAIVAFVNAPVAVHVVWYFAGASINVHFADGLSPHPYPSADANGGQASGELWHGTREIGLDDLVAARGHTGDPELDTVGELATKRRERQSARCASW